MTTTRKAVVAALALMIAPLAAHAQPKDHQYMYRCTAKDGKRYYGQTIPEKCVGVPLELINRQGMVMKRIDPEADEKARLAKEAEAEKKRAHEAAQKDANRRNQALLATYTSEADIEAARKRALQDHQLQLKEVERRVEEIKKRQARFEKDLATGKGESPTRLKEEISNAEIDLRAQEGLLEAKKKEAASINARYDEDQRRYREVTGKALAQKSTSSPKKN